MHHQAWGILVKNRVLFKFKRFLHDLPNKIAIQCRSAKFMTSLNGQHDNSGPADWTFGTRAPVAEGVLDARNAMRRNFFWALSEVAVPNRARRRFTGLNKTNKESCAATPGNFSVQIGLNSLHWLNISHLYWNDWLKIRSNKSMSQNNNFAYFTFKKEKSYLA